VDGKEGGLYFQIIHNRVVRQLNTDYKVFADEWDAESESIVIKGNRSNFLLGIQERLSWDVARLEKVVRMLETERRRFTADDVIAMFHKQTKESVKRAIPIKAIKELKELDLSLKSSLDFARDMFLFSFYTRGMSFVDMTYLKKSDLKSGILTYRRRKTGQQLTIKWEKCMEEIIAKYPQSQTDFLLPIIKKQGDERRQYDNALHLVNYHLKELSTMLKLQRPLTMYVARHSWASAAKAKNIPLSVISEGMGHDSEATTQIYLASLETSVVDKANKMILGLL
jgi:integrase